MASKRKVVSKRQRQIFLARICFFVLLALLLVLVLFRCVKGDGKYQEIESPEVDATKPEIEVALLDVNPYSRPGIETNKIRNIVIHYTANPGSSAMDNRNYFQGLKDSGATSVSSNFVVGIEGEIVQCVPTWEVAYASNDRNIDSVSIEMCHQDESGKPTQATYDSLVQLCAWLCLKFELTPEEVIRHYDVTGKNCPKYFVEDEAAFVRLKEDIQAALKRGGDK
ncbi:N-acetylmuramoyl-L-alanine amidase [Lachnospiraceae bacterium PM6-15]|uniref:peptidoglycan recognition protein family protein n=1 Tax=Ohessyouella blattaphilus TaxID=2949333 RepID=UPI003E1EF70B